MRSNSFLVGNFGEAMLNKEEVEETAMSKAIAG